jgi:DNA polymerase-3 subunit delta'
MVREDRLPHALLFWGPKGVGKSAAAIELARWLNCEAAEESPCGSCASCVKFQRLEHPHFSYQMPLPRKALSDAEDGELSQEGAENVAEILANKGADPYQPVEYKGAQFILIGQIRSLLHWASIKSFSDRPRVAFIDGAEKLKEEAGNALLKLLEEPPPNFNLILTAETAEDILPTLRSRCHSVEFERLKKDTILRELELRGFAELDNKAWLAEISGGNLSRAITFASDPERTVKLHELAINIVRHSLGKSPLELDAIIEVYARMDSLSQRLTLEIITTWLRDAAVLKELDTQGESRVVHAHHLDLLKKFVANCPNADFITAVKYTEEARSMLESNVLPQLTLLVLARHLYRAIYQRKPV